MIRAGKINEITSDSGKWVFLDIGFANKAKSCGLLFGDGEPCEVMFSQAVKDICSYISTSSIPVNLVIEAPLSVAFNSKGNPKGRSIEKQNGKTRYWYVSLGTTVMVAALYLVKAIMDSCPSKDIRLFEGFVSFKDTNKKTNHSQDVLLLRDIVRKKETIRIIDPDKLKMEPGDNIQSAFKVAGFDLGIPPVLMKNN